MICFHAIQLFRDTFSLFKKLRVSEYMKIKGLAIWWAEEKHIFFQWRHKKVKYKKLERKRLTIQRTHRRKLGVIVLKVIVSKTRIHSRKGEFLNNSLYQEGVYTCVHITKTSNKWREITQANSNHRNNEFKYLNMFSF